MAGQPNEFYKEFGDGETEILGENSPEVEKISQNFEKKELLPEFVENTRKKLLDFGYPEETVKNQFSKDLKEASGEELNKVIENCKALKAGNSFPSIRVLDRIISWVEEIKKLPSRIDRATEKVLRAGGYPK